MYIQQITHQKDKGDKLQSAQTIAEAMHKMKMKKVVLYRQVDKKGQGLVLQLVLPKSYRK